MGCRSFLLATGALVIHQAPASAQVSAIVAQNTRSSAPPTEAASHAAQQNGLADIVVTAQKREESVLSVPVAVSVIDSRAIEQARITTFSDITRVSPALTVTQNNDSNNSSIALRGIGTYAFSIGIEPSVSVVVDGVAAVLQAQAFSNLSDIERIEVLRGPQGTLFGKNASAGVVSIVTKAPSKVMTGNAEGTVTTDGEYRISAMLSGPITDTLGFRFNGYYDNQPGYIRNLTNGKKLNDSEDYGFRAKLAWQPTDTVDVTLIADYSKRNSKNSNIGTFLAIPSGAELFSAVPASQFAIGITPGRDNFDVRTDNQNLSKREQYSGIAKVNIDLGGPTLTSVSAYQHWSTLSFQDLDNSDFDVDTLLSGGTIHGGVAQGGPLSSHEFSEELRLTSPSSDQFEYLVGLFYSDSTTRRSFSREPVLLANWDGSAGTTVAAAFGQATYHFSEHTQATGGLRFNRQHISVDFDDITAATRYSGHASQSALLGKVSLQQFLDGGQMIYASFSTGYKGEGYDVSSGFNQSRIDNPVGKETSRSYEIGMKGKLFDNKVHLELTGFWTDYDGFQAQGSFIDPSTQLGQLKIYNVGKARTRGVEFQASAAINRELRLDANAAYTQAQIIEFPRANCYPGQTAAAGCVDTVQDLAGHTLSNAPHFKASANLNYHRTIPGTSVDGFVNLAYQWQSKVNFDLYGDPNDVQKAYGIANLNFGLTHSGDEKFKVSFFVNNLFNKHYVVNVSNLSGLFSGNVLLQQFARDARRYGGISVKVGF